jgi:Tol biopolymer transport system component
MKPIRQTLQDVFDLMGAQTSQTENEAKDAGIEPVPTLEPAAISATDPPQVIEDTPQAAADVETTGEASQLGEPTGRIIFTCQVDNTSGHDQICMVNADGTGYTQLTADLLHQHIYPSWAPDGESFVFSGNHSGTFKIYEMDLEGNMEMIGDVSGELYAPAVSPDGSQILFTRHISQDEHFISLMERDGSRVINLTNYYDAQDPVWSSDGSRILFSALEDGVEQFYTMEANGRDIQPVAGLENIRGRSDWALDLTIATFAGSRDEHEREIVLLEAEGTPVILTQGGDNLSPAFSPDGQWIAFMSYRDHYWEADGCEIYVMRRDGSDIRRLTDNTYCDYQPRWSK